MKLGKVSHFGNEYRKTPLPAEQKRPSQRGPNRVPEGRMKSQRDWSNSLKQARAPGTDIAELS